MHQIIEGWHALTAKLVFIFTAIVLALDHFDCGTLVLCLPCLSWHLNIVTLCILYYLSANGKTNNIIMTEFWKITHMDAFDT